MRRARLVFGLLCLLSGCSPKGRNPEAEQRVELFHQLYNSDRFGQVYEQSSPMFQQTSSFEEFVGLLKSTRDSLGSVKHSQLKAVSYEGLIRQRPILVYVTEFDRGSASEVFTFDNSDPPRLVHYNLTVSAVR